ASPAVVAMVDQAFYTLPELQAALRGDGVVQSDLARMQASAERIAAGDEGMPDEATAAEQYRVAAPVDAAAEAGVPDAVADAEAGVNAAAEAVAGEAVDADAAAADAGEGEAPVADGFDMVPASVDALLLEILDAEVAGHLVTVDAWVARASTDAIPASEGLLRALHTMNGAFAMTELPTVAQALTPGEAYVRRLLASADPAPAEGVAAIGELANVARAAIAGLQSARPEVPVAVALAARLAALRDGLPAPAPMEAEAGALDAIVDADGDAHELAPTLVDVDLSAYAGFTGAAAEDAERLEAERLEAERLEAERLGAERLEAERLEAERRSEEHTSELQSRENLVCRLLL